MTSAVKDIEKTREAAPEASAETKNYTRVYDARVDIVERKDDFVLYADIPGVDEKSVDITIEKDHLEIYGKYALSEPDGAAIAHREYGTGDYKRTFRLSDNIDRDGIKATVKHGVLTLTLPKAAAAKPRKIEITA